MNFFRRNLDILRQQHPYIDSKVFKRAPSDELNIVSTPSGAPTGIIDGNFIHSKYNPVKEARRIIKREVQDEITLCIFYGFGLGYLEEAFHTFNPDIPIAVIEPDIALFLKALHSRDLSDLLSSPRIIWFLEEKPESTIMKIENMPLAGLQIIRLRSVFMKNTQYYQRLDILLQSLLDRKNVNINTLTRFGRLWVRNLLQNIEIFIKAPGISNLVNFFSGIPSLVLAAGPSLDQVLPHLKELKKRLLIISVDTSFKLCLKQGIEPDFLIIVDPQYWNTRHLDWTDPKNTVLISESSTHPRVFRSLYLPTSFISSFFPLGQFMESITGQKGVIGTGGSVSTTAWDFARTIGAHPIYMAGLDLGFPQKKTHCRGAFFEEQMHILSSRLRPAEMSIYRYLQEANLFLTASNSKSTCYTDRRMVIYKWWFENQMKQYSMNSARAILSYNLSQEGVKIEGMPYINISRLLNLPPIREEIDSRIKRAKKIISSHEKENINQKHYALSIFQALEELQADLKQLVVLADQGLNICRSLGSSPIPGRAVDHAFKELNKLDKRILKLSSRQVAGFLFQSLIQKILKSADGKKSLTEVLKTTGNIYRELKQSSRYHIDLINRSLTRLNYSKVIAP